MECTCGEGAHKIQSVVLFEIEDLYDRCQRYLHHLPTLLTYCLYTCSMTANKIASLSLANDTKRPIDFNRNDLCTPALMDL
jgi:hypothetical protein